MNYSNIPISVNALEKIAKKHKDKLSVVEIKPDLTFERFWQEYNVKDKKIKALNYIRRYRNVNWITFDLPTLIPTSG